MSLSSPCRRRYPRRYRNAIRKINSRPSAAASPSADVHTFCDTSASFPPFRLSKYTKIAPFVFLRLLILKAVPIPLFFSFSLHGELYQKALSHLIFSIFKAVPPYNPSADTHLYARYPLFFSPHILSPPVKPLIFSPFILYLNLSLFFFSIDNPLQKHSLPIRTVFFFIFIPYLVAETISLAIQIILILRSFPFTAPHFFPVYLFPSVFSRNLKIVSFISASSFYPCIFYSLIPPLSLLYPLIPFILHPASVHDVRILSVILR